MNSTTNKRKSTAIDVPVADTPSKRRRGEQQGIATPTLLESRNTPISQPTFRPIARPARWRGPKREISDPSRRPHETEATECPKQRARPTRHESVTSSNQTPESRNVELRFSFTAATDQGSNGYQRDQFLNKSFSELLVTANANGCTSIHEPQAENVTQQTVPATSFIPDLSKPKKKREGYGFSYSETFWCDSDEYPDTECEWEPEEQSTQPSVRLSTSIKPACDWNAEKQTTQASFGGSTVVDSGCSFDDAVVVRDVGSFHIARPQQILPCTKATREDTIRLKAQAKALLSKYQESSDVQAQMLTRLERMVYAEQQKNHSNGQKQVYPVTHCALRLRNFLTKIKEERIETGEHRRFVEHEIEWVEWLVEASRSGVMHLRTAGCRCRPDWEDDAK